MHYFEVRIDEEPAATYQAFGVANEYAPRSTSSSTVPQIVGSLMAPVL
jgi:hypothetical protein